jgi:hypothetical protein
MAKSVANQSINLVQCEAVMADMTFEEVLEAARKLSTAEQARLISEIAEILRQKAEGGAAESEEKPFPSLASNLYEIAQDLEKNPPGGRPIPGN